MSSWQSARCGTRLLPRVTAVQGRVDRALPFDADDRELVALDQRRRRARPKRSPSIRCPSPSRCRRARASRRRPRSLARLGQRAERPTPARAPRRAARARDRRRCAGRCRHGSASSAREGRASDGGAGAVGRRRPRGRSRADPRPGDAGRTRHGARLADARSGRRATRCSSRPVRSHVSPTPGSRSARNCAAGSTRTPRQAHAFGLDEHPVVTEAHDRAEAALFTAPTDLDAANDLVFRYQQLVFEASPHGKGPR